MARELRDLFPAHAGQVWEDLARQIVARLRLFNRNWLPASRWWGGGCSGKPLELDIVAESADRGELLIGEIKWGGKSDPQKLLAGLQRKADDFPLKKGRKVCLAVWQLEQTNKAHTDNATKGLGPATVMASLR